jgi:hypothetical protein
VQYTRAPGGGKFGTSFPGRAFAGILQWMGRSDGSTHALRVSSGSHIGRNRSVFSPPAQAGELYLVTSEEIGIGPPPARYTRIPFRCSEGPADNHGAWYAGQPNALYRGRAYRPYYRYAACSAGLRTCLCSE